MTTPTGSGTPMSMLKDQLVPWPVIKEQVYNTLLHDDADHRSKVYRQHPAANAPVSIAHGLEYGVWSSNLLVSVLAARAETVDWAHRASFVEKVGSQAYELMRQSHLAGRFTLAKVHAIISDAVVQTAFGHTATAVHRYANRGCNFAHLCIGMWNWRGDWPGDKLKGHCQAILSSNGHPFDWKHPTFEKAVGGPMLLGSTAAINCLGSVVYNMLHVETRPAMRSALADFVVNKHDAFVDGFVIPNGFPWQLGAVHYTGPLNHDFLEMADLQAGDYLVIDYKAAKFGSSGASDPARLTAEVNTLLDYARRQKSPMQTINTANFDKIAGPEDARKMHATNDQVALPQTERSGMHACQVESILGPRQPNGYRVDQIMTFSLWAYGVHSLCVMPMSQFITPEIVGPHQFAVVTRWRFPDAVRFDMT